MFPAKTTIFFHFQSVGIILLVFHCVVVSLFALAACQSNFYSHLVHLLEFYKAISDKLIVRQFLHTKKRPFHQHKNNNITNNKCQEENKKFITRSIFFMQNNNENRIHYRIKSKHDTKANTFLSVMPYALAALSASLITATVTLLCCDVFSD